ncbi:LD-carboxypeptidase [Virgibacillus halodenitrificans]|uniref:S66 peptidase family protein n=1 Tax=Virgibacillus halodenitrificans TaxID=1482 RepID=UPI001FB257B7|nr:LD-carboxypeptidase [Virgibacillus halodenitrificans]MCJ0929568.1 LD-carboxypeptidase [Virgibacillus halodenitrificans]
MIKPERLQKGDTIGIIAPAGPPDQGKLQQAIPFFESLGLKVKLGQHINEIHGYLAGTDQQRLEDFHTMIADPVIKAIFFARGGYGTGRIVSSLDYELIRKNPKIIWGYSDITYLHTAIRQQTGLVTFHGPMVASDIGKEAFDDFTAEMFLQLFEPATYVYSEKVSSLHVITPGNSTGMLVGGNLSLIVSTLGTPFEIDTNGKLLLLEDIGEEPYRVDGMLNQLKLAGKLEEAAGVILGDFADTETTLKHSLTLDQVFSDYLSKLNCPVLCGFKIGHCFPHFAVPLGVEAELSADTKTLTIQAGVN